MFSAAANDMSNLLLLLIVVAGLGMATLLTLCLRRESDAADEDAQGTPGARPIGSESADLQRLMQNTVDQLEDIATLLRAPNDMPNEGLDSSASPSPRQSLKDKPPCIANAAGMMQSSVEDLTLQANQLLQRVALEMATREQGPGDVAGEIRRLAEYDVPKPDALPRDRESAAERPVAELESKT